MGFDQLIDPSGRTTLADAPTGLPQWTPKIGRLRHEVGVPPPQSRRTRRLRIVAGATFIAADVVTASALNFGSSLGQAVGELGFGSVAYALGYPAIEKAWRATRSRHQAHEDRSGT